MFGWLTQLFVRLFPRSTAARLDAIEKRLVWIEADVEWLNDDITKLSNQVEFLDCALDMIEETVDVEMEDLEERLWGMKEALFGPGFSVLKFDEDDDEASTNGHDPNLALEIEIDEDVYFRQHVPVLAGLLTNETFDRFDDDEEGDDSE